MQQTTHQMMNQEQTSSINVGNEERLVSLLAGAALMLAGLKRIVPGGFLQTVGAILGGYYLFNRGLTGHCEIYHALDMNTAVETNKNAVSVPHQQGVHVRKSITINASPEEVYRFWRNFENLPRFMNHLESVRVMDERRSHWVAKAPAGMTVEWDAEIINEVPNEVIGWRSLQDAQISNAGSVRFRPAPRGNGTEVRVELEYVPPAGPLGAAIARLFGEEPSQQIGEDLRRLKQLLETGEIATTEGQPSGRGGSR
ncbi:MAG: SRPBCC family protein [Chloroflexi bacterium]|nr:SRPBCC family protein [Chloroflexota bacterium]